MKLSVVVMASRLISDSAGNSHSSCDVDENLNLPSWITFVPNARISNYCASNKLPDFSINWLKPKLLYYKLLVIAKLDARGTQVEKNQYFIDIMKKFKRTYNRLTEEELIKKSSTRSSRQGYFFTLKVPL